MRKQIETSFWHDPYVESLSPIEKLVFLYLITNPSNNMVGIYETSFKRMEFEIGIADQNELSACLEKFKDDGKIDIYDKKSLWIIIANHVKHQNPNSNMKIGMIRQFEKIPEDIIRESKTARMVGRDLHEIHCKGSKPLETLLKDSKPFEVLYLILSDLDYITLDFNGTLRNDSKGLKSKGDSDEY